MKILGQIISVQPLALIISLPNQLLGHVPITQISNHLTNLLEAMEEDEDLADHESDNEEKEPRSRVPDLFAIFHPGQYVRAVVTAIHASGSTDMTGVGKTRDHNVKASRRVELSLSPDKINNGVQRDDLKPNFVRLCQFSICIYVEISSRRYQQLSKASRIMDTFLILAYLTFLDSCRSKMQRRGPSITALNFMLADYSMFLFQNYQEMDVPAQS